MVDKVALGRQGEIFVMQKLMENGWSFPKDYHNKMEGLDWVFTDGDRKIKIQVKTSEKNPPRFSLNKKISEEKTFDYLIFTNLIDCWIIPKEMVGNTDKLNRTFKKLKNKFNLLKLSSERLLSAINDCKIRFSELNSVSAFIRRKF